MNGHAEGTRTRKAAPAAEARAGRPGRQRLLTAGGVLGAIAASSCCIAPLVLFSLGASGAWLGNLAALAPYQPIFVVATLGFLTAGFWMVYRGPKAARAQTSSCTRPVSGRIVKIGLWSATVLVAAAVAFPYLAPLLLDV